MRQIIPSAQCTRMKSMAGQMTCHPAGVMTKRHKEFAEEYSEALFADVFIPQMRIAADEILHQPHAFMILQYPNLNAARSQQVFVSHERAVLTDYNVANPVKQNCS